MFEECNPSLKTLFYTKQKMNKFTDKSFSNSQILYYHGPSLGPTFAEIESVKGMDFSEKVNEAVQQNDIRKWYTHRNFEVLIL